MPAGKVIFNCDVVHLKFMRNPVECKDRVVNIADSAAINTF